MMIHKPFLLTMWLMVLLGGVGCRQQRAAYDAINAELQTAVPANGPGVALYVEGPGVGKQLFAAGLADVESGQAMRSDALFRIGPLTQPFTSTLIMQLIEEGAVSLDDTLDKWLPAEMLAQLGNGRAATIGQLLTMRSGIPDYAQNPDFQAAYAANPAYAWTPAEALAYAYGRPAEFAPGAAFSFSGTNYVLLQMVAEAVTGQPLAYNIRERFLYRLDLEETYLERAEDLPEGHVPGYQGATRILEAHEGKGLGDDGLVSTTIDLAEFVPALASRQLSGANADFTRQASDLGNGRAYGPGVMQWETEWGTLWGYEGSTEGFAGSMWYLPERKITLVALANDTAHGPALAALLEEVLTLIAAPTP